MSEAKAVRTKVIEIRNLSRTVKALTLEVLKPSFKFKAGQWVDFQAPGIDKVAGYSICSSPEYLSTSGCLQLAIKISNFAPTLWVHNQCQVDMEVGLSLGGDVTFDLQEHIKKLNKNINNNENETIENENHNIKHNNQTSQIINNKNNKKSCDLLLIAGGVGINPLISIYRHIAYNINNKDIINDKNNNNKCNIDKNVHLLYCATTENDLIFKDELIELATKTPGLSVEFIVTSSDNVKPQECFELNNTSVTMTRGKRLDERSLRGRVDKQFNNIDHLMAFVCGPYFMIDQMSDFLKTFGIPDSNIRFEKWW